MRDLLHSEIDTHEELRIKAADIAVAVREQVRDVAKKAPNFSAILRECAARVGNELAPLTTQAVRDGLSQAKRRRERLNDKNRSHQANS